MCRLSDRYRIIRNMSSIAEEREREKEMNQASHLQASAAIGSPISSICDALIIKIIRNA